VAEIEQADQSVSELQASPRELLRVTTPPSFSVLGAMVASFLERYPEVRVEVVCTDSRGRLAEGFDVAVRAGHLIDSSLVAAKWLRDSGR
jgi:DNA-binding transcriptional LysR family regulator